MGAQKEEDKKAAVEVKIKINNLRRLMVVVKARIKEKVKLLIHLRKVKVRIVQKKDPQKVPQKVPKKKVIKMEKKALKIAKVAKVLKTKKTGTDSVDGMKENYETFS